MFFVWKVYHYELNFVLNNDIASIVSNTYGKSFMLQWEVKCTRSMERIPQPDVMRPQREYCWMRCTTHFHNGPNSSSDSSSDAEFLDRT